MRNLKIFIHNPQISYRYCYQQCLFLSNFSNIRKINLYPLKYFHLKNRKQYFILICIFLIISNFYWFCWGAFGYCYFLLYELLYLPFAHFPSVEDFSPEASTINSVQACYFLLTHHVCLPVQQLINIQKITAFSWISSSNLVLQITRI